MDVAKYFTMHRTTSHFHFTLCPPKELGDPQRPTMSTVWKGKSTWKYLPLIIMSSCLIIPFSLIVSSLINTSWTSTGQVQIKTSELSRKLWEVWSMNTIRTELSGFGSRYVCLHVVSAKSLSMKLMDFVFIQRFFCGLWFLTLALSHFWSVEAKFGLLISETLVSSSVKHSSRKMQLLFTKYWLLPSSFMLSLFNNRLTICCCDIFL